MCIRDRCRSDCALGDVCARAYHPDSQAAVPVFDHLPAAALDRAGSRSTLDLTEKTEGRKAVGEAKNVISISNLPALNATLNAVSAVFLTAGYILIRRGRREHTFLVQTAALVT